MPTPKNMQVLFTVLRGSTEGLLKGAQLVLLDQESYGATTAAEVMGFLPSPAIYIPELPELSNLHTRA